MMVRRVKLGGRIALALLMTTSLTSGRALAQAEQSSNQISGLAPGSTPTAIQEIVVTARKKKENIQHVPVAITAVSGAELTKTGSAQLSDLLAKVPGLNLTPFGGTVGQNELILRGITTGVSTGSTVGVYVDGVPFGSSSSNAEGGLQALDLFPFDLEDVEVLKGPQGTLYGANSLSGLLKYETNPPDTTKSSALVEADATDVSGGGAAGTIKAMVNIPIIKDELALRVDGYDQNDPGWINNVGTGKRGANSAQEDGFRANLLYTPPVGLTIRLGAIVQNTYADGTSLENVDPTTHTPLYGAYSQSTLVPAPYYSRSRLYTATISLDTPVGQLVSDTSYSSINTLIDEDTSSIFGFPSYGYIGNDTSKWTQELRLVDTNRYVDYTFGLFYTSENSAHPQNFEYFPTRPDPFLTVVFPSTYTEYAGYGDLTVHITPKLDLGLGGRYSEVSQTSGETLDGSDVGNFPESTSGKVTNFVGTWSVNPSYRLTNDTLLYSRIATGFQPGGTNALLPGVVVPATYRPDTTTNYEVGVKSSLLSHHLQIDADIYDIEWNNIVLLQTFTDSSGSEFTGFGNGGTARSRGAELTMTMIPIRGLTVGLNGAYTNAYLTAPAPGVGGLTGDPLPYVPRWSGALSADYAFLVSSQAVGFVGGTVSYEDARNAYFSNSASVGNAPFGLDAYTQLDLRAGITQGPWQVELYAKNLTNVKAVVSASTTAVGGPESVILVEPLNAGLRVSRSF